MNYLNQSIGTDFIITGISDDPDLQAIVFLAVLLIYLLTIFGNTIILLLVCEDPHLHTPMYFFLANLSIMDMSSSTVSLHRIFFSFISGNNSMSYHACMTQLYIFDSLSVDELFLLTAMSYDRYTAICRPLYYHMVMSRLFCFLLALACWLVGFLEIVPNISLLLQFTCYKSKTIDHYFCDVLAVREIICNDKSVLDLYIFIGGVFHLSILLCLMFISYIFIIGTIVKIPSGTGRRKAFYTCSSHLTVVILLYMTLICQYLGSTGGNSHVSNKLFSLLNTAVVPMLNPLIYSLKNKDVKSSIKRIKCFYV